METQSKPLQRWIDARHQLDDAIEHFLESLNALDTSRLINSSDHGLPEKAASEAHQDFSHMTTRINKLQGARATLGRIRNDSTSFVPMNRLPLEVLFQIFYLFTRRSDPFNAFMAGVTHHHYPKELITLAQVSTHWRGLVINTPSLWSDFYFDVGAFMEINGSKSHNPFSVYLKHAHDRLSSITISSPNLNAVQISKHRMAISSFLRPHIKNIGILRLVNVSTRPDFNSDVPHFLFQLWQAEGRPGSVHSLTIFPDEKDAAGLRQQNAEMTDSDTYSYWNSFLLPIHTLRMVGPYFRWESPVFHNLVVLQVGQLHLQTAPTTQQIWAVLKASPQLEFLHLFDMTIKAEDSNPLQPIVLRALQVLDLRMLDYPGIQHLLPMIIPEAQELSLSLRIPDASDPCPVILSFLARSNITKLFLDVEPYFIEDLPIGDYLSVAPNIHSLIIELEDIDCDTLLPDMIQFDPPAMPTARCPKIHTLQLINGSFQEETIYKIVTAHPHLRKIGLLPCFLEPSDEEVLYWLRPLVNDVTHTRTGLSEETIMNWFVTLV